MQTEYPTPEDERDAIKRIKNEGGVFWDVKHPLRRFALADQCANVAAALGRLAAYRFRGLEPPVGYTDDILAGLHTAIKLVMEERPDEPWSLCDHDDTAKLLGIKPRKWRRG